MASPPLVHPLRDPQGRARRSARAAFDLPHWRARSDAPYLAFTRAELLVILAVLTLLVLVGLPALANNRPRSDRVICANNLRQIGMSMQLWGNDHDDTTPQETLIAQGGTRGHALAANVWLHFSWISNELA